jgi:glioma pathogenesis-related protein 2
MQLRQIPTLGIAGLTIAVALSTSSPFKVFAQSTNLQTFRQQALSTHNSLRQKHGAPPLVLDNTLNNVAQGWADKLAATGKFQHSNSKYGENLYYGWSSQPGFDVNGVSPVQSWYDEVKSYNYSKPGFSMETGHFTQVVWKNSKKLGCGKAKAKDGKVFVVCNYDPPGNYQNQFPQNVLPAK